MDYAALKTRFKKWTLPIALGLVSHHWEGAWSETKIRTELSWSARTWESILEYTGLHPNPRNSGPITAAALERSPIWYWPEQGILQIGDWIYQKNLTQPPKPSHSASLNLGDGVLGLARWVKYFEQEKQKKPVNTATPKAPISNQKKRIWY